MSKNTAPDLNAASKLFARLEEIRDRNPTHADAKTKFACFKENHAVLRECEEVLVRTALSDYSLSSCSLSAAELEALGDDSFAKAQQGVLKWSLAEALELGEKSFAEPDFIIENLPSVDDKFGAEPWQREAPSLLHNFYECTSKRSQVDKKDRKGEDYTLLDYLHDTSFDEAIYYWYLAKEQGAVGAADKIKKALRERSAQNFLSLLPGGRGFARSKKMVERVFEDEGPISGELAGELYFSKLKLDVLRLQRLLRVPGGERLTTRPILPDCFIHLLCALALKCDPKELGVKLGLQEPTLSAASHAMIDFLAWSLFNLRRSEEPLCQPLTASYIQELSTMQDDEDCQEEVSGYLRTLLAEPVNVFFLVYEALDGVRQGILDEGLIFDSELLGMSPHAAFLIGRDCAAGCNVPRNLHKGLIYLYLAKSMGHPYAGAVLETLSCRIAVGANQSLTLKRLSSEFFNAAVCLHEQTFDGAVPVPCLPREGVSFAEHPAVLLLANYFAVLDGVLIYKERFGALPQDYDKLFDAFALTAVRDTAYFYKLHLKDPGVINEPLFAAFESFLSHAYNAPYSFFKRTARILMRLFTPPEMMVRQEEEKHHEDREVLKQLISKIAGNLKDPEKIEASMLEMFDEEARNEDPYAFIDKLLGMAEFSMRDPQTALFEIKHRYGSAIREILRRTAEVRPIDPYLFGILASYDLHYAQVPNLFMQNGSFYRDPLNFINFAFSGRGFLEKLLLKHDDPKFGFIIEDIGRFYSNPQSYLYLDEQDARPNRGNENDDPAYVKKGGGKLHLLIKALNKAALKLRLGVEEEPFVFLDRVLPAHDDPEDLKLRRGTLLPRIGRMFDSLIEAGYEKAYFFGFTALKRLGLKESAGSLLFLGSRSGELACQEELDRLDESGETVEINRFLELYLEIIEELKLSSSIEAPAMLCQMLSCLPVCPEYLLEELYDAAQRNPYPEFKIGCKALLQNGYRGAEFTQTYAFKQYGTLKQSMSPGGALDPRCTLNKILDTALQTMLEPQSFEVLKVRSLEQHSLMQQLLSDFIKDFLKNLSEGEFVAARLKDTFHLMEFPYPALISLAGGDNSLKEELFSLFGSFTFGKDLGDGYKLKLECLKEQGKYDDLCLIFAKRGENIDNLLVSELESIDTLRDLFCPRNLAEDEDGGLSFKHTLGKQELWRFMLRAAGLGQDYDAICRCAGAAGLKGDLLGLIFGRFDCSLLKASSFAQDKPATAEVPKIDELLNKLCEDESEKAQLYETVFKNTVIQ